jgi:hypothetical protein
MTTNQTLQHAAMLESAWINIELCMTKAETELEHNLLAEAKGHLTGAIESFKQTHSYRIAYELQMRDLTQMRPLTTQGG